MTLTTQLWSSLRVEAKVLEHLKHLPVRKHKICGCKDDHFIIISSLPHMRSLNVRLNLENDFNNSAQMIVSRSFFDLSPETTDITEYRL